MQIQEFTNILQRPNSLRDNQIDNLKVLVDKYPYFQPARALYLKALKNKESYKYNNALKVTAAHTTDRSILFDFITSAVFNQNEISAQITQNSEHIKSIIVNGVDDISIDKSMRVDDALNEQIEATKGALDPDLFQQKKIVTNEIDRIKTQEENASAKKKLQIGKPLEFTSNETHSFSEWLKISSFKPIDRTSNKAQITSPLDTKLETINKFISENPKIKPVANTPKPKLVDNSQTLEDSLMTETLARIYLEQKNYEKAIQSYRILSLKYPEKSSFFADQIKAVKELSLKNNTDND